MSEKTQSSQQTSGWPFTTIVYLLLFLCHFGWLTKQRCINTHTHTHTSPFFFFTKCLLWNITLLLICTRLHVRMTIIQTYTFHLCCFTVCLFVCLCLLKHTLWNAHSKNSSALSFTFGHFMRISFHMSALVNGKFVWMSSVLTELLANGVINRLANKNEAGGAFKKNTLTDDDLFIIPLFINQHHTRVIKY